MPIKSTEQRYGGVAIGLHWVSALLILFMIPLGFLMQNAPEDGRLIWYRLHVLLGLLVLLLTLVRLVWKFIDSKPSPPPGLTGIHLRGMEVIHVSIYFILIALVVSGIVLNVQSGFLGVLQGANQEFPKFAAYDSRQAHGVLARLYIALMIAHIGGVVVHHFRHGGTLERMGIGRPDE